MPHSRAGRNVVELVASQSRRSGGGRAIPSFKATFPLGRGYRHQLHAGWRRSQSIQALPTTPFPDAMQEFKVETSAQAQRTWKSSARREAIGMPELVSARNALHLARQAEPVGGPAIPSSKQALLRRLQATEPETFAYVRPQC
jgi:hypothetical protein